MRVSIFPFPFLRYFHIHLPSLLIVDCLFPLSFSFSLSSRPSHFSFVCPLVFAIFSIFHSSVLSSLQFFQFFIRPSSRPSHFFHFSFVRPLVLLIFLLILSSVLSSFILRLRRGRDERTDERRGRSCNTVANAIKCILMDMSAVKLKFR